MRQVGSYSTRYIDSFSTLYLCWKTYRVYSFSHILQPHRSSASALRYCCLDYKSEPSESTTRQLHLSRAFAVQFSASISITPSPNGLISWSHLRLFPNVPAIGNSWWHLQLFPNVPVITSFSLTLCTFLMALNLRPLSSSRQIWSSKSTNTDGAWGTTVTRHQRLLN